MSTTNTNLPTTYDELINLFSMKMIKNPDFFYYRNISDEEATQLTKEKCLNYLNGSLAILLQNCSPDVDFNEKDDMLQQFNFTLTNIEKELLLHLMFEIYLEEDLSRLKAYEKWFSTKELNTFSPASERNSFISMYDNISDRNIARIKNYMSRDRQTGKLKGLNYSDDLFSSLNIGN